MRSLVVALVAALLTATLLFVFDRPWGNREVTRYSVSQILSSQSVQFLTTDSLVTRGILEIDASDWLRGQDRILATATIRVAAGINLELVSVETSDDETKSAVVRLPDTEVFSVTLDEESFTFWRDATLLHRIEDLDSAAIQTEARQRLKAEAVQFLEENGALPDQSEMEDRFETVLRDFGFAGEIIFLGPPS